MKVTSGTTDQSDNMLGLVVDEYLERRGRGENPDIEAYAQQHPEFAEVIRVSLQALELADGSLSSSGASVPDVRLSQKQTLGDFRILDELGHGGMGVVYEAEQISMGRRVALKVLPFAAMAQEKALQRFRNEVRAAALLDHPNIVSVYSIGEDRGVHYYAMQLIRGQTLAEVIAQLIGFRNDEDPLDGDSISQVLSASKLIHAQNSTSVPSPTEDDFDSRSPPPDGCADATEPQIQADISTLARSAPDRGFFRSVARLGIQAATALQHAHDLGVLHRDIKPGNLMLDASAQLHITDFGLARIGTDVGVTMTGDVIGTLRYMAPEQGLAKRVVVDHRADIYSLGVTLYELLTLQPAFDQTNRPALLKQIAFEEPQPPRRVQRSIPAELETIVLKAMAKNPDERYASATQLAEDLESFVEHRPIKAKPPTLIQTATKWCRRHQVVTWSAALLLVSLAIGSSIASLLIWQEKVRTSDALHQAEAHLNIARQAIDTLLVDMAEELEDAPAATTLQLKLLENALSFYENFPKEVIKEPGIRLEMASAFQRTGEIYRKLEDRNKAMELYEKASPIYRKLSDEYPAIDEYRLGLAKIYRLQAEVLELTPGIKRPYTFSQLYQQSVNLLEELAAKNPDDPVLQHELAYTFVAQRAGRELIFRAVKLLRDLVERFPDNDQFADSLSNALFVYSDQLERDSDFAQAESLKRESLVISQQLVNAHPKKRDYRRGLAARTAFLGISLCARDRHGEGDEEFEKAISLQEELIKDYPKMSELRTFLLFTLGNHTRSLLHRGMLSEARHTHERFLKYRRAELEDFHHATVEQRYLTQSLNEYGTILYELGELELARRAWQECLTLARTLATENPKNLRDQGWFAWISNTCPFHELRDSTEADGAAAKALELVTNNAGDFLVVSGWGHYRAGNWQVALETFDRAEGRPYTELVMHEADRELGLAATKLRMGQREDAIKHYHRARALLGQDERWGYYPYVSRRLSADVGRLLELDNESKN